MRLNAKELASIKKNILAADPEAQIYLFGSRVHDHLRGGDIDLLVISQRITTDIKRRIKLKLYDDLGEQKIDLIITKDLSDPFHQLAVQEGIKLC